LLRHEELWWAQRAKVQWLKHGDLNTKFIHYKASQRKRKNYVHSITDNQGITWKDSEHIFSVFNDYFANIFKKSDTQYSPELFKVVKDRISNDQYDYLDNNFTSLEVLEAISNLKSNSAPGPDGLTALFFQKYWDIIGSDILSFVLNILNNGASPSKINHTFISLIPKVNSPSLPSDFRPISLRNVILKIITKTIANRIKKVLPSIINEFQSAFLSGRLKTDNSLIVFETFHYLNKTRKKSNGFVGIKLDMAKAYDSLEWDFIENTLRSMGFPIKIILLIMSCINSVLFSVLVNGKPSAPFLPQRGLR
jgi:hypothetical protein